MHKIIDAYKGRLTGHDPGDKRPPQEITGKSNKNCPQ
jgi:hypothetical protein